MVDLTPGKLMLMKAKSATRRTKTHSALEGIPRKVLYSANCVPTVVSGEGAPPVDSIFVLPEEATPLAAGLTR